VVDDATAFILAGGQSSRMGSDKAALIYQGETLLKRSLAIAGQACGSVVICGSRARYGEFGEVVEDLEPGRGPLGGIQAALHATQTGLNLILSVDMPLIDAEFLRWLLEQARSFERQITAPQAQGQVQPLCAVFRREACMYVDEALAAQQYKVTALFRRAATRIISEEEIGAAGFNPKIFTNVNTPEEYALLMQSEVAGTRPAKISHE
jgi:molybdopterin-guanine dinucleotide biosynthesis protein A